MQDTIHSVLKSIQEHSGKYGGVFPISYEQGKFLNDLIRSTNAINCLELGVSHGFSTIWQAEALRANGGKLIAVEQNPAKVEIALANLKMAGLANIVDIRPGSAQKIVQTLNKEFDIVFMDIVKDQYIPCFDLILPKIKNNGIILADNMLTHQLVDYQDYVRNHPKFISYLVPIGNGFEMSVKVTKQNIGLL
jgi:predicted O-methyltransferase YrrM